jgi:xanthine permease XanP
VGLALIIGLAADILPALFQQLPEGLRAVFGTSLVLGTLIGLGLNLLFRVGVRKTGTVTVPLGPLDPVPIEEFMEQQGAVWGARRDVIERAKFNVTQSVETILDGCDPQGPLQIEASFDEFSLDIRISYAGAPMVLPEVRPSNEEIIASEEGQRALSGFLLRRFADRVRASHVDGRSTILFHFDH